MISDIGPVKGTNNTNLGCGLDAQKAAAVAAAQPGSTVSFEWVSNTGGNVSSLLLLNAPPPTLPVC